MLRHVSLSYCVQKKERLNVEPVSVGCMAGWTIDRRSVAFISRETHFEINRFDWITFTVNVKLRLFFSSSSSSSLAHSVCPFWQRKKMIQKLASHFDMNVKINIIKCRFHCFGIGMASVVSRMALCTYYICNYNIKTGQVHVCTNTHMRTASNWRIYTCSACE